MQTQTSDLHVSLDNVRIRPAGARDPPSALAAAAAATIAALLCIRKTNFVVANLNSISG